MNRQLIILLTMCLCLPMAAQMHRYSLGFTVTSPVGEAGEGLFADTIDIEFENHRILLPIEIEGKKYRFMFDTGCTQGSVFSTTKIPTTEVGRVAFLDINSHRDTVTVVQLPQFRLGHLAIDGYLCTVIRSGPITRGYDGIIGFDLINKGLCCKIDVENKRLILTDRKKFFAQEQGYEVKYKMRNFVPYVWVSPFMRHMDRALFDTGYSGLYRMNRESFQKHVYKSKQVVAQVEGRAIGQHTIGVGGVEIADTVYFLALDRLKWDRFSLRNYHTVTQVGSSHVGAELLDYGRVIINPFKKRIIFQPNTKTDELTVGNSAPQMYVVPAGNRPSIGLIREESEAYRNGMRRGDVILKINDRDIPSVAAYMQFPFVKGETYTFTVRTEQGNIKKVQITK